ncbi:MAG: RNA polymerase sigma factor [Bacteroidota bacterium]|jgi:RNA polymerase sigma-70 factor (ECF subfamily)|nr:RNA polymerase sigma factor [Bacteroidota bacterium]
MNRNDVLEEVSQDITQDHALQQRIREGDNAAFAELYSCHKQGVYLYCTRFLGDQPAAEDIFQEVFINLLERVRAGSHIENVQGYLMRSARNRCLNVIRDRKYPKDVDELEEILPGGDVVSVGEYEDLESALQRLPAANRDALLLCEYQGYSYDEISAITDVPVTTVRKRIFRARQRLRQILGPDKNRNEEQ